MTSTRGVKRISENRKVTVPKKKARAENVIEADDGQNSLLLALPREMLDLIFSFLALRGRMRARASKLLWEIEDKSKYQFHLVELDDEWLGSGPAGRIQGLDAEENSQLVSFECIDRIANRTSVERLEITLPGLDVFSMKSSTHYKLFKKISFKNIRVKFEMFPTFGMQLMTNSFVHYLCQSSEWLSVGSFLTVKQMHQVYTNILDDSMKISGFRVRGLIGIHAFLSIIGITLKDGQVLSSKDAEVIKYNRPYSPYICHIVIFDGLLEIDMDICGSRNDAEFRAEYLMLRLHESKESIETRKICVRQEKITCEGQLWRR